MWPFAPSVLSTRGGRVPWRGLARLSGLGIGLGVGLVLPSGPQLNAQRGGGGAYTIRQSLGAIEAHLGVRAEVVTAVNPCETTPRRPQKTGDPPGKPSWCGPPPPKGPRPAMPHAQATRGRGSLGPEGTAPTDSPREATDPPWVLVEEVLPSGKVIMHIYVLW